MKPDEGDEGYVWDRTLLGDGPMREMRDTCGTAHFYETFRHIIGSTA
jgi:hypothetical protein